MNYALILAGGTGSRAGGSLPKQFQMVKGKRMIWWSVEAFKVFDSECRIVMAVHKDFLDKWEEEFGKEEKKLGYDIIKIEGGRSRFQSVKNALNYIESIIDGSDALASKCKLFIHDGARPLVSPELIERGANEVAEGKGAVPVVPLVNSIRKITPECSFAVDRNDYVVVQTPQVFLFTDIKKAYDSVADENEFTDDASVAEKYGLRIAVFPGDSKNIKVTNPEDFRML